MAENTPHGKDWLFRNSCGTRESLTPVMPGLAVHRGAEKELLVSPSMATVWTFPASWSSQVTLSSTDRSRLLRLLQLYYIHGKSQIISRSQIFPINCCTSALRFSTVPPQAGHAAAFFLYRILYSCYRSAAEVVLRRELGQSLPKPCTTTGR